MKPWNSGDSVEPVQHTYDQVRRPETQAEIDLCINCPLPEKRCAGNGGCYLRKTEDGKVVRRQRKQAGAFNPEVYVKAKRKGLNDEQIAALFGVTKKTVKRWGERYGNLLEEGEDK